MPNEAKCKRPACNAPGDLRLGDYCSTECEIYHLDEIEINKLKAEVKRLRDGIKKYCHVTENALEMWEHEEAYASLIDEEI